MAAVVKASQMKVWTGTSWKTLTSGKAVSVGWNTKTWYPFGPSTLQTARYDFNGNTLGFWPYEILSGDQYGATSTYLWGRTGTGLAHSFRFGAPLPDPRVPAGSYRIQMYCRITKQKTDPDSGPVELSWGAKQDVPWVIGTYNTKGWGTHTSPTFTQSSPWPFQPNVKISGGSLYDTVTTHEIHIDWIALQTSSGVPVSYLLNNQFHVWDALGNKWYAL